LEWVRFYTHDEFHVDFRLFLRAEEVPGTRLSAQGETFLGWTSWIRFGSLETAAAGQIKI